MVNRQVKQIRKELTKIEQVRKKLRCSRCGSKQIYTNKDRTKVCRFCGFRGK